jgi:hypothetical protein
MVRPLFQKLMLGFISLSLTAGCNFTASQEENPTHNPATVAARTLEVVYTNVAAKTQKYRQATQSPGDSPEKTKTSSPTPEEACINRARFVDDITIRDNMQIEHGTNFLKVWRLRNDGTCVWNRSYSLIFFGGERMGATNTISLPEIVQPGQTIDLAIDMTAPEVPGTYQSFWRLQSGDGDYFGIGSNGDQSFWVKISVSVSPNASPTETQTSTLFPSETASPSETPTPTATPQPTPIVHGQGDVYLNLGQVVDLDSGEISPIEGGDLSLDEQTTSEYSLNPRNNTLLVFYSGTKKPPSKQECERIPKLPLAIPLSKLAVNDNLCYITGEGRPGYLTITALNSSIEFSFTTWVP